MLAELENLSNGMLIQLLRAKQKQTKKLEKQTAWLGQQKEQLEQHKEQLEQHRDNLEQEVLYLKHQLEKFKRLAFGQKRERFEGNSDQILLPFQLPEAEKQQSEEQTTEKISYERKKATPSAH